MDSLLGIRAYIMKIAIIGTGNLGIAIRQGEF